MKLLGVRIDSIKREDISAVLERFFQDDLQHMIATPNAEMLVYCENDRQFREILNNCSLNVCDSTGVFLAARFLKNHIPCRLTGVDLVDYLCDISQRLDQTVFFLGGKNDAAEKAAENFKNRYAKLKIFSDNGGKIEKKNDGSWEIDYGVLNYIKATQPKILIVALGHPKQEYWIHAFLKNLPSVKIAIGVGGALDFYAGSVTRAPAFMRKFGFEWLWRLLCEPKRINRIFTAIFIFPFLVLTKR